MSITRSTSRVVRGDRKPRGIRFDDHLAPIAHDWNARRGIAPVYYWILLLRHPVRDVAMGMAIRRAPPGAESLRGRKPRHLHVSELRRHRADGLQVGFGEDVRIGFVKVEELVDPIGSRGPAVTPLAGVAFDHFAVELVHPGGGAAEPRGTKRSRRVSAQGNVEKGNERDESDQGHECRPRVVQRVSQHVDAPAAA